MIQLSKKIVVLSLLWLCFSTAFSQDCQISNVIVEASPCGEDGYFLTISFDSENMGDDGFSISRLGENYGPFSYEDNFAMIGPFTIINPIQMTIRDNQNSDCLTYVSYDPPNCFLNDGCDIFNFSVSSEECNEGAFDIIIDFDVDNSETQMFDVFYGIDNTLSFSTAELPITIENYQSNNETVDMLWVCMNDNPNCCSGEEILLPVCQPSVDCSFSNIVVEAYECDENGAYLVDLAFDGENVGDFGYTLMGYFLANGENYGSFDYNEVVTVGPIENIGSGFLLVDNQYETCRTYIYYDGPNCNLEAGSCDIFNFSVEAQDCNEDGTFDVIIDFDVVNPSADFFNVQTSQDNITQFSIGDLPVTLENYPGNGNQIDVLFVTIGENSDCTGGTEFEIPACAINNDCQISNLIAEAHDCDENGMFLIDIAFDAENEGNLGYVILGNGQNYGTFSYDLPFVTLGPFGGDIPLPTEFLVHDNLHDGCSMVIEFEPPNCNPSNECQISNIIVEAHECDENNQFLIDIAFDSENTGNEGFTIRGNGENYGTFSYDSPFVTLGPFDSNSTTPNEFVIIDNQMDACQAAIGFDPPNCTPIGDCGIFDLSVMPSDECNDDGTYSVTIDFIVEDAGNDFFEVYQNDILLDYFLIADLPLTIEQFQGSGNEVDFLRVCINDVPDCCASTEFLAPNCNPTGDCQISNLIAEAHNCDENGMFFVDIDFDFQNEGNLGFIILGNGQNYGTFSYDLPFVTLGPFDSNGEAPNEFLVHDALHDGCSMFIEFESPICTPEDNCEIFDVTTDALVCDSEESFALTISFETENANNDFFDVFLNDDFFGFYSLVDLPVTFDEIPLNDNNSYIFRICVNDNPNCCTSFSFNLPPGFCGGFNVWPGDGNVDNIVNHFDLLHLGIAYGSTGTERENSSIAWEGLPVADWNEFFENNINYKHADCNGDGIVNASDVLAIQENYGLTHDEVMPSVFVVGNENDPALRLDIPESSELPNNSVFDFPILLGTEDLPVEDLYGLAFTLHFDPDMVMEGSVGIEYPENWIGENGTNLMTLDRTFESEGSIDIAITRIDQTSISGFGEIARFVGMVDDILGLGVMEVTIENVKAIKWNETPIAIHTPIESIKITTAIDETLPMNTLRIFPNPTSDMLYVKHHLQSEILAIQLMDMHGKVLEAFTKETDKLSLKNWPSGVYLLKIETKIGTSFTKVVKL